MTRDDDHPVPSLARRPRPDRDARTRLQYLLDLDPELGGRLDVRMRLVARGAVTAATFSLEPGELDLSRWLETSKPELGLLILDGALVRFVRVCDRSSAELLGRGDLIQPRGDASDDADEFLGCELSWQGLSAIRFAVLDSDFADRIRAWPQIEDALLARVQDRARDLAFARAINAQPRLELRLVLMLWHLAPRWGKVERGGIRVPLPLTHQLLGRLVGAERPSVSHALKRLAGAGLVDTRDGGLHLKGTVEEHLSVLGERADDHVQKLIRSHAGARAG